MIDLEFSEHVAIILVHFPIKIKINCDGCMYHEKNKKWVKLM